MTSGVEERTLTTREMSQRSGIAEGTLRMWEARHGFPTPERLPSGHRRYAERDVAEVRLVLAARTQGLSLGAAIERARGPLRKPEPSVFAALRSSFPHLQAQHLPKRALLCLSHAIEDESMARADRPLPSAASSGSGSTDRPSRAGVSWRRRHPARSSWPISAAGGPGAVGRSRCRSTLGTR